MCGAGALARQSERIALTFFDYLFDYHGAVHKLAQSVLPYMREHDLLRPGDRAGVAVSGGADSVALFRLMLELQDELGIILFVVHLNHKLRSAESDADEKFVRDLAAAHGLEIVSESRDVKAYAAQKKLGLETAAREVRYEFFRCLLESNLRRIATAHTLDDQAETVMLKLARCAGTRGLAGIYPKLASSHQPSAVRKAEPQRPTPDEAGIVRPLLATPRFQLREYLAEIGQSWREDATNQDLRHTRNRIRHQVLPLLVKEVNPGISEVLGETAEIARAEEAYWSSEVCRALPQVWEAGKHGGVINCRVLYTFPLALQRRLVRAAAECLGLSLEFRHTAEILGLGGEGHCAVLPSGWMATLHAAEIEFSQSRERVVPDYEYELPVPGRIAVAEAGIELEALISVESEDQKYSPEHLVGAAFVQRRLGVRNWRAGERFWPAHSKEPKKIKELLQDRHITGERKRLCPVVVSGDEIVWLRGFGVRRDFQSNDGKGILIREVGKRPDATGTKTKL